MTVDATTPSARYTVAGIGPYALDWPYFAGTVGVAVETGLGRVVLAPEDITAAPTSSTTSGNLFLTPTAAALYAGAALVIERDTPEEQGWAAQVGERERGMEVQLDRQTMSGQEHAARLAGTLRIAGGDVPPMVMPLDGQTLIWHDGGVVPGPTADQIAAAGQYADDVNRDMLVVTAARDATLAAAAFRRATLADLFATTADQIPVGARVEVPGIGVYERVASGGHMGHTPSTLAWTVITRHVDELGAVGDGATDDSAAFAKAALIGGKWRLRVGASYRAANVVLAVNGTSFSCEGVCAIIKNANGPIFSGPAADMDFTGIDFRGGPSSGSGLTGHNLDFTGARIVMARCNSMWAAGRAVKSGAKIMILSPIGVYQTDDTSATGYDIEIGNSLTATSYASVQDITTSQSTGGILFINPGMVFVSNSQFGKLTTQNIGSPSGISGGAMTANRILGKTSIGVSNTSLIGNVFSSVSLTLEFGITGCFADNIHALGSSVVDNSGNQANTIIRRQTSVPSNVGLTSVSNVMRQGDDTNSTWWATHPATNNAEFSGTLSALNFGIPNLGAYRVRTSGGSMVSALAIDASNNITVGSGSSNYTTVLGGAGGIYFSVSGASVLQAYATGFRPQIDNVMALGTPTQAWGDMQSHKVTTRPKTVATLPAGAAGARSFVTDSSVAASGNFGAIVAGGGANGVPVYHDGTNWRIG